MDADDRSENTMLTVKQAAARAGVHPDTIRAAIRRGELPARDFTPGSRLRTWRIRPVDLEPDSPPPKKPISKPKKRPPARSPAGYIKYFEE